jgi:hypothetical protein
VTGGVTAELVGGPHDGRRISLAGDVDVISVPVPVTLMPDPDADVTRPEMPVLVYRLSGVRDDGVSVFRCAG